MEGQSNYMHGVFFQLMWQGNDPISQCGGCNVDPIIESGRCDLDGRFIEDSEAGGRRRARELSKKLSTAVTGNAWVRMPYVSPF